MANPWEEFQAKEPKADKSDPSGPWAEFSNTKKPYYDSGPVENPLSMGPLTLGPKDLRITMQRRPADVNWLDAISKEFTKPMPKGSMVVDNPVAGAMAGHGAVAKGASMVKELAKDAVPIAAGYVYDKIAGGNAGKGSGVSAAILRRLLSRGK